MIGKTAWHLALTLAVLSTIGCDRVTKHAAATFLSGLPSRSYLADTVRLGYVENTGGFLSFGAELPSAVRTGLFTVGTGLLLCMLVFIAIRRSGDRLSTLGLALFIAGGASNWFDRVTRGSVVDFLNVGVGPVRTGVFNVADVAIMLGAGVMVIATFGKKQASSPRYLLLFAAIVFAQPAQGHNQGVPSSTARDIAPGGTHAYRVQARAGDLVAGTIDPPTTPLSVELYDVGNAKPRVLDISSTGRIGFIAPTTGTYRLQVSLTGTQNLSYSLKLSTPVSPSVRMRGVHVQPHDTYRSERLSRLSEDVQSRRAGGVERFWEEVRNAGGYLLEPLRESDQEPSRPRDDLLVTFFWKATYDTYNVLFSWFGSARPEDYYMSHLPGTDVWYKTLRVYRDSRFSYTLSPNDRPEDRGLTSQTDPANPVSTYGGSVSVFATRDAPMEWFRDVPARRGLVQEKRFESALLGGVFPAWIYTPPDYAANGGPYALVILFDGEGYVGNFDDRRRLTPAMLDNLVGQGRMRPSVVCFLGGFRGTGGLAPLNEVSSDSVATELLPWLRSMYAISANSRDVVIGGYSAGGTKASLVALKYPTLFGNVLSQSGAFRGPVNTNEPNLIARLFVRAERVPIRFYLDVGLYDPGGSVRADDESNTAGNRHFRDVLQAKGYEVIYRETGGAHEFVHWSATLAEALMALLSPGR